MKTFVGKKINFKIKKISENNFIWKLNFNINVEFPLNITKEYIDELLKNNKVNQNYQPINTMYL